MLAQFPLVVSMTVGSLAPEALDERDEPIGAREAAVAKQIARTAGLHPVCETMEGTICCDCLSLLYHILTI